MSALRCSLYFSFISFLSLFFSCSESTSPIADSGDGLIPLKVGNNWSYNFTDYDSSGSILAEEFENRIISKDTLIGNNKWYAFNNLPQGIWFSNKADGYWQYVKGGTGTFVKDTSVIVYRYPTQTGDIYVDFGIPREVLSTDEEITVPAGTFKVIHITENFQSMNNYLLISFEIYISPKIGIIKEVQIGKKSNGDSFIAYKRELSSYSLK